MIHQYLQHKHYALWEVIEFGVSYEALNDVVATGSATEGTGKKTGWTVALTIEDIQKRKNDVKARTTVLLALPDEHQLRFSKYKTAKELWAAILKTFGGNKATKKTKKNLLKQQYGNFKAEGSETLEQSFNRVQAIVSHLEFMDIEIEQDDLNQKFLTSLATEWLIGSQIKFENITQIDKDDMEEIDIKCNMVLLSTRADRFWKKTRKKISIQGTDVARFDKSKVECFNCHKMGHFARECRAPKSQDMGRRDNYKQGSKVEEQAPKALMAIDEVGWDWRFMGNEEEDHALVADEETHTEFALMAKTSADSEVIDNSLCSKTYKKNIDSLNRLPKFSDDTVTDYSRPSPAIESTSDDVQNRNPSVTKTEASPSTISSKPFIKFVKASDRPTKDKTYKVETAKKPTVKATLRIILMTKAIGTVVALGTWLATYPIFLTMNHLIEDMCLLVKEDARLLAKEQSKQNSVLFIDSECIVLGRDFKLIDDTNVLLRTPRQHNMYSIDLNNIVPHKDLTCLVAKASADECMLWHKRLGHLNIKTMNRLVRHNLVRGLPSKCFENNHTCVACSKGKQHKASCKTMLVNSVTKPLHTLHMDLFGPTSISSLNHKWYCLVVTDDFS
nr:putative ribonuclease H-like domain-containing protein [Tanacetum cinerariifolium]